MKTIIITGVGKGFGKSLFLKLVKEYRVIGITRSKDDCKNLRESLDPEKYEYHLLNCDVTNYGSVLEKLKPLLEMYEKSIYGLINNAGMRYRKSMTEITIDEYKRVGEVNLFAPIFLTRLVLPCFIQNQSGRVINISSILSTSALPELSAYAMSKSGLDGFTRSCTAEFASKNITFNSVLPGFCKTSYFEAFKSKTDLYEMTIEKIPARRWGEEDEIFGLCKFLLSGEASYINGASIPIDGGWTAC